MGSRKIKCMRCGRKLDMCKALANACPTWSFVIKPESGRSTRCPKQATNQAEQKPVEAATDFSFLQMSKLARKGRGRTLAEASQRATDKALKGLFAVCYM